MLRVINPLIVVSLVFFLLGCPEEDYVKTINPTSGNIGTTFTVTATGGLNPAGATYCNAYLHNTTSGKVQMITSNSGCSDTVGVFNIPTSLPSFSYSANKFLVTLNEEASDKEDDVFTVNAQCVIGGNVFNHQDRNPNNQCQECNVYLSYSQWSSLADNASCDDGIFCNGLDSCLNGNCTSHAGDPCDNGLFCDGIETCNETTQTCSYSSNPCQPPLSICNENFDRCAACELGTSCNDLDEDGYCNRLIENANCGQLDCNDSDEEVHPNGDEVCDGIDTNCDGQVLIEDECIEVQGFGQNVFAEGLPTSHCIVTRTDDIVDETGYPVEGTLRSCMIPTMCDHVPVWITFAVGVNEPAIIALEKTLYIVPYDCQSQVPAGPEERVSLFLDGRGADITIQNWGLVVINGENVIMENIKFDDLKFHKDVEWYYYCQNDSLYSGPEIYPDCQWDDLSIDIGENDQFVFVPGGEIVVGGETIDPWGSPTALCTSSNCPLPNESLGALLMQLGDDESTRTLLSRSWISPANASELKFTINIDPESGVMATGSFSLAFDFKTQKKIDLLYCGEQGEYLDNCAINQCGGNAEECCTTSDYCQQKHDYYWECQYGCCVNPVGNDTCESDQECEDEYFSSQVLAEYECRYVDEYPVKRCVLEENNRALWMFTTENISGESSNFWIDHCTFSNIPDDAITMFYTINDVSLSWNYFYEQNKCLLLGWEATYEPNYNENPTSNYTIYNNYFLETNQRHPSSDYRTIHYYNNLMEAWNVDGVVCLQGADCLVTDNIFDAANGEENVAVSTKYKDMDEGFINAGFENVNTFLNDATWEPNYNSDPLYTQFDPDDPLSNYFYSKITVGSTSNCTTGQCQALRDYLETHAGNRP